MNNIKNFFAHSKKQGITNPQIPPTSPPPPPPPPPPPQQPRTKDVSSPSISTPSPDMEPFDEALLHIPDEPLQHDVQTHPESRNPTNIFKRIRDRLHLKEVVDDSDLLITNDADASSGQTASTSDTIPNDVIRFVCLSDTHNKAHWLLETDWWKSFNVPTDIFSPQPLPAGDVLLHSGDFTNWGRKAEVEKFNDFLGKCPYLVKIVIAGNHELTFDPKSQMSDPKDTKASTSSSSSSSPHPSALLTNAIYLQDDGVDIGGIRVWGSPWQPVLGNMAFNAPRGDKLLEKWNRIPGCGGAGGGVAGTATTDSKENGKIAPVSSIVNGNQCQVASSSFSPNTSTPTSSGGIDILLTHGPPLGIGDKLSGGRQVAGCSELLATVRQRVRPKFHVYGHIHEHNGCWTDGRTTFINAAICNGMHYPMQKVWKFDVKLPSGVDKKEALGNIVRFGI